MVKIMWNILKSNKLLTSMMRWVAAWSRPRVTCWSPSRATGQCTPGRFYLEDMSPSFSQYEMILTTSPRRSQVLVTIVELRESLATSSEGRFRISKSRAAAAELCAGRKVVVFGVPGAFTPGCSKTHLPGYVSRAEEIKGKGIEEIVCVSVNDPFVMEAWGKDQGASGKVS